MGTFDVSLKTIGDREGLAATVHLENGRLAIDVGDESIGDWALTEISLQPIPTGYRMAAEGDQILLELRDVEGFEAALNSKRRRRARKKAEKPNEEPAPKTKVETELPVEPKTKAKRREKSEAKEKRGSRPRRRSRRKDRPENKDSTERRIVIPGSKPAEPQKAEGGIDQVRASAGKPVAEPAATKEKEPGRLIGAIDGVLESAEERWGSLLPRWVFSRLTIVGLLAILILMAVFPTWISTILLVLGIVVIMFGAIVYTDPMLVAKWLPGRMAPAHVLLTGLAVLMLGVALGVIAN